MRFFSALFSLLGVVGLLTSCLTSKIKADYLLLNATVYTVDSAFAVAEAFAVKDGKILEVGTSEEIKREFQSDSIIDASGTFVYPGLIDAHCHFYYYGLGLKEVNLIGTVSFEEVINRLNDFSVSHPASKDGSRNDWLIGRGWDQNDWADKSFPDRKKLDSLFPDRPVLLTRIDGHAALANKMAMKLAGIHANTSIVGGKIEFNSGKDAVDWTDEISEKEMGRLNYPLQSPTGILIDNAVNLVSDIIPPPSRGDKIKALLDAQRDCFSNGLTTLDDAGLEKEIIFLIDSLQRIGDLKMRIYAMLSSTDSNFNYFLKREKIKTERLNVRSFKFYADGALGSRGACLKHDYSDKKNWKGFLLQQQEFFSRNAKLMFENGFQMNTHCIGDSSDLVISEIYLEATDAKKNPNEAFKKYRWRIEHAQVVSESDRNNFSGIIPSVQPTHATSDMYWADERLGKERVREAYAYQSLLKKAGLVALGTDFPVEEISPVKTFYAAVFRKDKEGFPSGGFQTEDALTREQALRGMTIWAAFSNFEDEEKGSIEKGKFADFVLLDKDLMRAAEKEILSTKVLKTYLNGESVFDGK